ncbi:hypothetical protein [Microbacterium sp. NPDC079208]|uniref:hypothetical protein n=1 Tax=Microbacterium sp. NPDC079208 TaxID=3154652 RepID=UPI0034510CA1
MAFLRWNSGDLPGCIDDESNGSWARRQMLLSLLLMVRCIARLVISQMRIKTKF